MGECRALECHVVLVMELSGAAPRPQANAVTEVVGKGSTEATMGGSFA